MSASEPLAWTAEETTVDIKPLSMSSPDNDETAATAVYNPYKIFQVAQRCMGNSSVVAEVLVELLGDCATPEVLMASAASVLSLYYLKDGMRKSSMTDFGKFAGELADELGKRDSIDAEEKLREAQSVYELFEEADTDGNGSISKEEFLDFGSNIGVPTEEEALELFDQVDTDKNGVISFLEWLHFCVPGAGRDEHVFDCAGHHGLRSYITAVDGVVCKWCDTSSFKCDRMFGCRECDCDACLDCAMYHLKYCTTRISCDRVTTSACALRSSDKGE